MAYFKVVTMNFLDTVRPHYLLLMTIVISNMCATRDLNHSPVNIQVVTINKCLESAR